MNPLETVRQEITRRIENYEMTDEIHMNKIMTLESELKDTETKRKRVQLLIGEAKKELAEIEEFIKWKESL